MDSTPNGSNHPNYRTSVGAASLEMERSERTLVPLKEHQMKALEAEGNGVVAQKKYVIE